MKPRVLTENSSISLSKILRASFRWFIIYQDPNEPYPEIFDSSVDTFDSHGNIAVSTVTVRRKEQGGTRRN